MSEIRYSKFDNKYVIIAPERFHKPLNIDCDFFLLKIIIWVVYAKHNIPLLSTFPTAYCLNFRQRVTQARLRSI